ncbi:MAG TPA: PLD nuclease N-terminal domain-containing protein [Candidatus Limnocylindrales bacterium]|nr:PLD nuclease N-terminal domain-containing protein [Candidatus Limnocylindrales bacterium]
MDSRILLLVLPIIAIQLGLIVLALRDLLRPERQVRGGSKLLWGLVIVLLNIIGPLLYFAVGRREG